jgi:putative ABC transport system permease protein
VTLADGEAVPLTVAAVVSDDSAPADLFLTRATVRAHDPSALTSAVYLAGPPPSHPVVGARVVAVATYAAETDAAEDRLVWTFTLLLVGVSAGYGALAVANTLLMASARRREDFRVLRLSGASTRQVCLVVAAESALVVVIGSLLGGLAAIAALLGGLAALREQVGADVGLVVPWPTVGAVVATCLMLAVTASVIPAIRRQPVVP